MIQFIHDRLYTLYTVQVIHDKNIPCYISSNDFCYIFKDLITIIIHILLMVFLTNIVLHFITVSEHFVLIIILFSSAFLSFLMFLVPVSTGPRGNTALFNFNVFN